MANYFEAHSLDPRHIAKHKRILNEAKSNYNMAIDYYSRQREKFIDRYNKQTHTILTDQEVLESLIPTQKDYDEVMKQQTELIFDGMIEVLNEQFEILMNGLDQKGKIIKGKQLKKTAKEWKKLKTNKASESKIKEEREKFKKQLTLFLNDEIFRQEVQDQTIKLLGANANNGFQYKVFEGVFLTVRNSIIREILATERSSQLKKQEKYASKAINQKNKVKGSLAELNTFDAIYNALSIFENSVIVEHTGPQNTAGGADITISFPSDIKTSSNKAVQLLKETVLEESYGVQVKSWSLDNPKIKDKNTAWGTLSHNSTLKGKILNSMSHSEIHQWCAMVKKMSLLENVKIATDNCFIWKLGHETFWTDHLIREMQKQDYFFAFRWNLEKDEMLDNDTQIILAKHYG